MFTQEELFNMIDSKNGIVESIVKGVEQAENGIVEVPVSALLEVAKTLDIMIRCLITQEEHNLQLKETITNTIDTMKKF